MPIRIIRANIVDCSFTDVIVNSADTEPKYNFGVDRAIYQAAGEKELLAARKIIGKILPGEVRATDSFNLKSKTKKIFHAVVPIWRGGSLEETKILRTCYQECFKLLKTFQEFSSISFPILGAGNNGFPVNEALRVAIAESIRFLLENDDYYVTLVTFDKNIFQKCRKIFPNFVKEYIKNSEVKKIKNKDDVAGANEFRRNQLTQNVTIEHLNRTFTQKLSEFMERKGLNLDNTDNLTSIIRRGHISDRIKYSIINDIKDQKEGNTYSPYRPLKETAVRFAVTLKLSLTDTLELLQSAGRVLYDGNELDRKIKNFIFHNQNIPEQYTIERMESEIPEYRT